MHNRAIPGAIALLAAIIVPLSAGPAFSATASSAATVVRFVASPANQPHTGGPSTFTATVTHALTCTFTAVPAASLSPVTVPCGGGRASHTFAFPPNLTPLAEYYTVGLVAHGPLGSSAAAEAVVEVAGIASGPRVLYLSANPTLLEGTGGRVTLSGETAGSPNLGSCVLFQTSGPTVSVTSGSLVFEPCNTPFTVQIAIPPEPGGATYTFAMSPDVAGHANYFPDAVAIVIDQTR